MIIQESSGEQKAKESATERWVPCFVQRPGAAACTLRYTWQCEKPTCHRWLGSQHYPCRSPVSHSRTASLFQNECLDLVPPCSQFLSSKHQQTWWRTPHWHPLERLLFARYHKNCHQDQVIQFLRRAPAVSCKEVSIHLPALTLQMMIAEMRWQSVAAGLCWQQPLWVSIPSSEHLLADSETSNTLDKSWGPFDDMHPLIHLVLGRDVSFAHCWTL